MLRIDAGRLIAAITISLAPSQALLPTAAFAQRGASRGNVRSEAPPPSAWIQSGPSLAPNQPAQLGYELPRGGYLTILRASTDGSLSVVYPSRPNSRSNGIDRGAIPIRADADPGVGYLFWVTSPTPFDFRSYSGRDGRWAPAHFGSRGGDPFEQVDRFARGTTRGRYDVGYSSYRVGALGRDGRQPAAVHGGDYGYTGGVYGGGAYGAGAYGAGAYGAGAYGNGYATDGAYAPGGYSGWWGGPQWNGYSSDTWRYRQSWRDREYDRAYDRASYTDPRSKYLRHCADGTLAPYTVSCGDVTGSHARATGRRRP